MANTVEDWSQYGISMEEKDKLVGEVIRYMLFKTHLNSGCPIKRTELTQLVTKNYHQRNLPTSVINEAKEKLSSIFGYEMRELQRSQPSSKNQAQLSQQNVADSKSYVLISQLPSNVYKKYVDDENSAHMSGFTFVIVSIVHLAGGKITAESLFSHMRRMGLSENEESHPLLGNVKHALELLVQQRYLQKDNVNGPDGNTLFYELAERALDGPISDKVKEYVSQNSGAVRGDHKLHSPLPTMVQTRSSQMPLHGQIPADSVLVEGDQSKQNHEQQPEQVPDREDVHVSEDVEDMTSSPPAAVNPQNLNAIPDLPDPQIPQASITDPDIRLMQNVLQAVLKRMETTEHRSNLQRLEDMRRMREDNMALREEICRLQVPDRQVKRIENPDNSEYRDNKDRRRERVPRHDNDDTRITADASINGKCILVSRDRVPVFEEVQGSSYLKRNQCVEDDQDKGNQNRDTGSRTPSALGEYRRKYSKGCNNSPFSDEILSASYPEDFNTNFLPEYDGSQDPQEHLDTFDMFMGVQIDEPIISRIFVMTLSGAAQRWFNTLSPKSIHNFNDLGRKFLLNFATSKKHPKSEFALGRVKQQPGETLQKYLDRFNNAALQVHGLQESVHVHLIVAGLDGSSRLAKSIYKDPVKNLMEFTTRSMKYLELEQMEIANALGKERKRNPPLKEKDQTRSYRPNSRRRNPDSRPWADKYEAKYEKYTPLNVSRSQLWKEVALTEMKKVERPRPIYNKAGVDLSRFCAFHDGPGHTTDQCWDLRDAVEKFVREGKLRQYVIKTQGKKSTKRRQENRSKSPAPEKREKREKQ